MLYVKIRIVLPSVQSVLITGMCLKFPVNDYSNLGPIKPQFRLNRHVTKVKFFGCVLIVSCLDWNQCSSHHAGYFFLSAD